jgi:hypothetical protein
MQDEEKIIDVGEADYEETEVDLEAQPEPKEEPKEELEVQQVEEEEKVEEPVETKKEELNDYSESVNKRIAKLTRRMREAERQKEEAIEYAKKVNTEAQQLKNRFENLDSNYTAEFEKRVTTNLEAAKAKLQNAINAGDVEAQTQANLELAELANDHARLNRLKQAYENKAKTVETPAEPAQPTQPAQPAAPAPDPRADAWAQKNPWFGVDNAMTYTAFDIHKKLVEEGFDPAASPDEYYSEVDKRIRLEFPHKFANNEVSTAEPVQTVASAKRPATKGRRKTVKLTPSQVAISKRLGVPLEEYAKQLAAKEV